MLKGIDFNKYLKEGLKNIKENSIEIKDMKPLWVKKLIPTKDWNLLYKNEPAYCFLNYEKGEGVWAGFCIADFGYIPNGCKSLNDEELRIVDNYRRSHNILPTPLRVLEPQC